MRCSQRYGRRHLDDRPVPIEQDELEIYLSEPAMEDHFEQPLRWWAANKLRLPRLYAMAIDHLSLSPASTECERCFSLAKLTISTQRHSLKENTVRQI